MTFETGPVLHLERGRFPEYPGAQPDRVLTELARRFGRVAIVDADGVRANDADLEFLQAASRSRPVWADAGSRYATDAMDLFVAGAELVTLRWNTLRSPDELEEALGMCQPGTLFLGLEYPHGKFLPHAKDKRDAAQLVRFAEEHGAGVVFILDPQATADTLRALPPSTAPRWIQGASKQVAEAAQEMGFQGALLAPIELGDVA